MEEGYRVLEDLGYPLTPANEVDLVRHKQRLFYLMLKIMTLTPLVLLPFLLLMLLVKIY